MDYKLFYGNVIEYFEIFENEFCNKFFNILKKSSKNLVFDLKS